MEGRTWEFCSQPTLWTGVKGTVDFVEMGREKNLLDISNLALVVRLTERRGKGDGNGWEDTYIWEMVDSSIPWLIKTKNPSVSAA